MLLFVLFGARTITQLKDVVSYLYDSHAIVDATRSRRGVGKAAGSDLPVYCCGQNIALLLLNRYYAWLASLSIVRLNVQTSSLCYFV